MNTPVYGWQYPPFFLLVAAPLALMPYLPALIVWQLGTLLLYLAGLGFCSGEARRRWRRTGYGC